jgi:predicted RNA binding protein YcfA (HicA-like mRNA interferase family)
MKFREIIKIIENDGWYLARQKGSHMQFRHPVKSGLVTVAPHSLNDDVSAGTLSSIYKQAQIEKREI